jgi:acetyl esterase/lipase
MHRLSLVTVLVNSTLTAQTPWWQRPVVLKPDSTVAIDVREGIAYKGVERVTVRMDVYRPRAATSPLPAVIFVHGGPIPSSVPADANSWGQYTSFGRLIASHGLVAVTFAHRLTSVNAIDTAAADVRDALAYVVSQASSLGVDPTRLCLWAVSAGGTVVSLAFREYRDRLRCFVSYYNLFTPRLFQDMVAGGTQLIPQHAPSLVELMSRDSVTMPATFVIRAGKDDPRVNADLDGFVMTNLQRGTALELHAYPEGDHAFDIFDDTEMSRALIRQTIAFVRSRLFPQ